VDEKQASTKKGMRSIRHNDASSRLFARVFARWAHLDEAERPLEDGPDGRGLARVERRQAGRGRQRLAVSAPACGAGGGESDELVRHVVPQQLVVQVPRHGRVVDGERLERVLHPVVARALPKVLDDVVVGRVRDLARRAQLELDLAVDDALDVAHGLPVRVHKGLADPELEAELVPHHDPRLLHDVVAAAPEAKDRHGPVGERRLPPHAHRLLAERLLELAVVVGLDLDERRQHVLVVVPVLVRPEDRLHVRRPPLAVLQRRRRRRREVAVPGVRPPALPKVLEGGHLPDGDLARPELEPVAGLGEQPRDEPSVLDERVPPGQVPVHVLEGGDRLDAHPAQQDDDRAGAGGHEPQDENVPGPAVVALQDGVPERGARVELDLVRTGLDEVVDEVGGPRLGARRRVAEPLLRVDALGDAGRVVDPAVPARVLGQSVLVVVVPVVHGLLRLVEEAHVAHRAGAPVFVVLFILVAVFVASSSARRSFFFFFFFFFFFLLRALLFFALQAAVLSVLFSAHPSFASAKDGCSVRKPPVSGLSPLPSSTSRSCGFAAACSAACCFLILLLLLILFLTSRPKSGEKRERERERERERAFPLSRRWLLLLLLLLAAPPRVAVVLCSLSLFALSVPVHGDRGETCFSWPGGGSGRDGGGIFLFV
jgi:hypothetical protein